MNKKKELFFNTSWHFSTVAQLKKNTQVEINWPCCFSPAFLYFGNHCLTNLPLCTPSLTKSGSREIWFTHKLVQSLLWPFSKHWTKTYPWLLQQEMLHISEADLLLKDVHSSRHSLCPASPPSLHPSPSCQLYPSSHTEVIRSSVPAWSPESRCIVHLSSESLIHRDCQCHVM